MCTRPIKIDENTKVACRSCNECIAARKNDWVARAMAEKAISGETLLLDLTYRDNPDGTTANAAKIFNYSHIKLFLKKLREQYKRDYGKRGEIRFLICGERGSKRGRVHWHLVLFSDKPISTLGEWTDGNHQPLDGMRDRKRDHWTFWDHGFVYSKLPTLNGMQYALKYALKDQFNVVKSKGTMREAKSENHGASYFRMSKTPPIGERYLAEVIQNYQQRGIVPVEAAIKIPEYNGYWWPKGKLREQMLLAFHEINKQRKTETGRDCPQWAALTNSLVSLEKDWETLTYGTQTSETEIFDPANWERSLLEQQKLRANIARATQIRRNCGSFQPCEKCFNSLNEVRKAAFVEWHKKAIGRFQRDTSRQRKPNFNTWWRQNHPEVNFYCAFKGSGEVQAAFKRAKIL